MAIEQESARARLSNRHLPKFVAGTMLLISAACAGDDSSQGGTDVIQGPQSAFVYDDCGNEIELEGFADYQVADESALPPLAWAGQTIDGVVSRLDATTVTFSAEDLVITFTSEPVDAICRPFSDE